MPDNIILDCKLPDGRYKRYIFTDKRALIRFTRELHGRVLVNLAHLDRPDPVPVGLMAATRTMLEVIRTAIAFIDAQPPEASWCSKLTEDMATLMQEMGNG